MANAAAFQKGFDEGRGGSGKSGTDTTKKLSKPVGQITSSDGQTLTPSAPLKNIPSRHKGGKVKKTGLHNLKKGEIVLTAAQAKAKLGKKSSRKSSRKKVSTKR